MATMWPKILPAWVLSDPRRSAEIEVFNRLERGLGQEWIVYYSRPWWGISPRGGEIDGEADFIVAHPEQGMLFVEVKGGAVSYDPELEQWSSRDRNGIRHHIKDPMKQASTCKHRFLKRLQAMPGWPQCFVRFRHGVVFPHCASPNEPDQAIGPYEQRMFCFEDEFAHALGNWIAERLAPHPVPATSKEQGPGTKGVALLHDLVAKPVSLLVPLHRQIIGEIESMEGLLTGAQLLLIPMIGSEPRALVEGGAGTGKTVLAIEMSAREAKSGRSVLFCCRSSPLAKRIAGRLSGFPAITVTTFDNLASACGWNKGDKPALPAGKAWDVVVIDEGQDFDWEWWDLVENVVQPEIGRLCIFADSNQAVYRRRDDLETRLRARSFPLRVNLRNTRPIARATESLYEGPLIEAPGPDGPIPVKVIATLDDAVHEAVEAFFKMIKHDGIDPSMAALLVPSVEIRERVMADLTGRGISVADALQEPSPHCATVETIALFKGLEAPIVLMVADRLLGKNQELSYVGVSRARARLTVLGPISGTVLDTAIRAHP